MLLEYNPSSVRRSRIHPDYFLRAEWHDYTSKCVYMVTFLKSEIAPALSRIYGGINSEGIYARYEMTQAGRVIYNQLKRLDGYFNFVSVVRYVIMPDHVHILLNVKEKTETHLGDIVGKLKRECTREFLRMIGKEDYQQNSLFMDGYNDKIVFRPGQYEGYKTYIKDNPRRFFIRMLCPEFFHTWRNVKIGDKLYCLYGNFELLRNPCKSAVRFSRKYTGALWQNKQDDYKKTIDQGGVLVSPFIHPNEKDIRDKGIELGASIIRIVNNGLARRFKPGGREFELCAEGRLLLIAPMEHDFRKTEVARQECLEMNRLAEVIADLNDKTAIKMQGAAAEIRKKIR